MGHSCLTDNTLAIPGGKAMPVSCPNMTPGSKPHRLRGTQVWGCSRSTIYGGGELGVTWVPHRGLETRGVTDTPQVPLPSGQTQHTGGHRVPWLISKPAVGGKTRRNGLRYGAPNHFWKLLFKPQCIFCKDMYIALDTPHTPLSGRRKGRTENEGRRKKNLTTDKGGSTHTVSANRHVVCGRSTLPVWVDEQAEGRNDTNHYVSKRKPYFHVLKSDQLLGLTVL